MNISFLNSSLAGKTPLTGDAGNRSYSRVQFEGSNSNYILCTYPEKDSDQFDRFVNTNTLLQSLSVNTANIIDRSKNQMLLEDLGDISLEADFKGGGSYYPDAIDELIKIQSCPTQGASTAQSYSFTEDKFSWEMNFAVTHFSQLLNFKVSEKSMKGLQTDISSVSSELCKTRQVLTHRDFHSRNLMVFDKKVYVIDFQDARIGPAMYDLVSLVEDSYTRLEQNFKTDLIELYCSKTDTALNDKFLHNYHLQNIQRSFKACGSFASFKNRTNNERYLQYLKPALESLRRSFDYIDSCPTLKKFIFQLQEEWANHDRK